MGREERKRREQNKAVQLADILMVIDAKIDEVLGAEFMPTEVMPARAVEGFDELVRRLQKNGGADAKSSAKD